MSGQQFVLSLTLICSFGLVKSQTGPGGVGASASNTLWLKADDIGQADGTPVSTWADRSGNGHDATQGTGSHQPTYETGEVNGHSVVRLDGINDYFDDTHSYDARTIFAVYNILSTNMQTSDLGQIWGNYPDGTHVSLDARNTGKWSFDGDGGPSTSAQHALNGANYSSAASNPNSPVWTYDQYDLVSVQLSATRSMNRQVIGSLVPSFGIGAHQYGGDIAEIIVFNTTLNEAERVIVENYLAAYYGITVARDRYAHQFTHPYDVAGIGQESAGNSHTAAMSADMLQIQNASSLDDDDYLLFGHDNADATTWTATESPDGGTYMERFAREWRLNETGDVGTVEFLADISGFPAQPGSHSMYGIAVDSDGDFSSGATVYELVNTSGNEYGSGAIDISDGDYVTIVSLEATVEHTDTSSSGAEPDDASVSVELNFVPQNDVTVDYTTADGSALAAEPDYTAASPGTLTITAPSTSNSYTISINNDVATEPDEDFTITLSNPSVGSIGTNATHTYTIQDDDNPRKIYFDESTSSASESTTSGSFTVSINLVDGTNPTTVDYDVTSGNASGGGTDYTLASGTLTIPSSDTVNTINFTINNDNLSEVDETFTVTLSNPTNCNLDAVMPFSGTGFTEHTYTILDDDAAPTVQFNSTSGNGAESVSPANFQVDLSTASGADVTVDYTVTGTATGNGTDYLLANGTLTITQGNTTESISATIVDDAEEELSETVVVTLSNPSNATLGANTEFTYTINDNDQIGTSGPGGVGEADNLQLWLRADDIAQADGSAVSSWPDFSGNGHDATQATGSDQPTYQANQVNGHSVVRFDGNNDYLSDAHSYSARTVFVVYRMLSANQNTDDLAQPWGSYGDGVQVGIDARGGGGGWSFDGGGSTSAKLGINGAAYSGFGTNPGGPNWSYDVFEMVAVEFDATKGVSSQDIGSLINPGGHLFGGDIAEIIVYNLIIDDAQRNIIENHLSAKYNIAISNDLYAYDSPGNHEYDVGGIGREDGSNFHLDAQGTGFVRMNNPNDLGDGEYLFWGHDSAGFEDYNTSDVPPGIHNRMEQVWRVDETGDVGTVSVSVDLDSFTINNSNNLVLLIDDDGTFANASQAAISSFSSNTATFDNVGFDDGDRFTVASTSASNPLPLELLSFSAKVVDNRVNLNWVAASHLNLDYFMVEKSKKGNHYTTFEVVHGKADANSPESYHAIDNNPHIGKSYYRLAQVGFNGNRTFSKKVAIEFYPSTNHDLRIYPNPWDQTTAATISLEGSPNELVTVSLKDLSGKTHLRQIHILEQGINSIELHCPVKITPGVYLLKVTSESRVSCTRLVIH